MIKYVKPVRASAARGVVGEIYAQIKREFGTLGEPLTLHSPIPDLLGGVWFSFWECLISGVARRDLREAVAVAVSRLNRCPYCIDAHTVMLRATAAHSAAGAIQYGRDDEIEDEQTRAVVKWAAATRSPGAPILHSPPFSPQEAPEFIGAAVWVHYINRMVQVFLSRKLLPISSDPLGIRTAAERMGGWYFSRFVRRSSRASATANLLPEFSLPDDLSWAAASQPVARAFAAFAAAADKAGAAALPSEVRACVQEQLRNWNGADPGLGRARLEEPIKVLNDSSKPAARLALLGALAPYQIDQELVREIHKREAGDERLLGCLAWASFAAARTIGRWLSRV